MYLKLGIFCILNVIAVRGLQFFGIQNGFRRLMEDIRSIAILTSAPILTKWIEQKLDHFDTNETRTWKMKYFERTDFWKPNGPIYLFIGGESPAAPGFLTTGAMYELAKETRGAMFMTEHRYYGDSQPVNRENFEDMKYLSVKQALADNVNLLKSLKKNARYSQSKVVVIGGSYAANLATWMKLTAPDLIDAAIASSGPVIAERDFYEYLEVVNKDYEEYGTSDCLEKIQNIFERYDKLFQSEEGIKRLKKEENICEDSDMEKPENKQAFFASKTSQFMGNAQYGNIDDIKNHCSGMNGTQATVVLTDNDCDYWNEKQNCFNYSFNYMIELYRQKENDWALCWTYQTCTEFGFFQSTTSDKQPFTKNIPVEFYDKICTALFGVNFDKNRVIDGVKKINEMYGARSPNVTQVVFVNGEMDPWSALGIVEDVSYDAPAVYIPRSSHCRDLYSDRKSDPEELVEARAHIKQLIKKWIGAGDYILPKV